MAAAHQKVCSFPGCESKTKATKKCGACRAALYCSQLCQSSDWPVHSTVCVRQSESILLAKKMKHVLDTTPAAIPDLSTTMPLDLKTYTETLTALMMQGPDSKACTPDIMAALVISGKKIQTILEDPFLEALFLDNGKLQLPAMPYAAGLHVRPSKAKPGSLGLFTDRDLPEKTEITMYGMQAVLLTLADIDGLSSRERCLAIGKAPSTGWIATPMCQPGIEGRMEQTRQNVYFACGISAICAYYEQATDENRMWLACMAMDPALAPGAIVEKRLTYMEFCERVSADPMYFGRVFKQYTEIINRQCNAVLCDHDSRNYCSLLTVRNVKAGDELLVPFGFSSFVHELSLEGMTSPPNYSWVSVMMRASLGIPTTTDVLRNAGLPCKKGCREIQLPVNQRDIEKFIGMETFFFWSTEEGTCACPACKST